MSVSTPPSLRVPPAHQIDQPDQRAAVIRDERDRRFQRVKVNLLGRYMLSDRREFPCQIIDMSPGAAMMVAPVVGQIGEKVIAYIDHIGRVEGAITRAIEDGFAMDIQATMIKRDKWASQLTWLANKDDVGLEEDRRHERHLDNRHSKISLPDGRSYNCKIMDISLSGAAIQLDARPALGTPVVIGRIRGRIVRHFEDGIAVEFAAAQQVLSVVQRTIHSA